MADLSPLIVAASIGLGVFFLGMALTNWLGASSARFSAELGQEPVAREQSARVIRALGNSFGALAAPFQSVTDRLDQQLTYAGRPYGGVSGQQYLAATFVLSLLIGAALGLMFAVSGIAQGGDPAAALVTGIRWGLFVAVGVGAFLIMDVSGNAKRVSDQLEREFPFFLDLAVLVVQAGGTPRKALSRYVEASPGTPLAREIAITAKDADATSYEDALYRMIERVQATSVKVILKNLAQGEKTSGEVEDFYADQAEELRFLREEMANRTAERLKTNIVLPVFLMMISIIIAALAPTIVSIRGQGLF